MASPINVGDLEVYLRLRDEMTPMLHAASQSAQQDFGALGSVMQGVGQGIGQSLVHVVSGLPSVSFVCEYVRLVSAPNPSYSKFSVTGANDNSSVR